MTRTDHHESEDDIIQAHQQMDRRVGQSRVESGFLGKAVETIRATAGRMTGSKTPSKPRHSGAGSEGSLAEVAERAKRAPRDG